MKPRISIMYIPILSGSFIVLGLYLASLYNYLLFHSLAEIFSIIIACGIFMVAWNSRRFLDNNFLLFIGIAFLFVAGIDLIHTLAYTGMNIFKGYETNLPTQLWISARYFESLSLLIAPFFIGRRLKIYSVFLLYGMAFSLLLLSIFYWKIFPVCFIEGVGLTPFKKISEYIISLILLASIVLLLRNRKEFDSSVLQWVVCSIVVTIVSELAFTFYIHAYGFSNLIGHFFKILSFYFIYKAIIETGLVKPYDLLFRNLKKSEEALREAKEGLETKVAERTNELRIANEQLRFELTERKRAEEALQKVNRALKTLSECNQALVRAPGEVELLRKICQVIVELGGYRLAWVGLAEQDKTKAVRPVAQAGYEEGYLNTVNISWGDTERGCGPTGAAIRTGKPIFARNMLTDPNYAPWRDEAIRRSYASSIALPLIADGRPFGALNIYASEPDAFDAGEVKLLTELADDLAYGIVALRTKTEHKRNEESLRESEQRYRSLFDRMPIGLYRTTPKGQIVDANPSLIQLLGFPDLKSLQSINVIETYTNQDDLIRWQSLMKQEGIVRNYEKQLDRSDGSIIWVEENTRAVRDSKGEVLFYEGSFQDITERKRAEEEMTSIQEQLRQSQKMEAIGRLAGGIAHDFNNVLTVIKGYSQLSLIELKEGDPLRANIEEIQKATERAVGLTRQILAFSRRQVMEMRVLDLNTLLRDLDKMLHRVIGEDIELVTLLTEDLGRVKVDPGQIEQVIMNLAVNARDAMPSGGKLTIETANVELDEAYAHHHVAVKPGHYVMLSVSDTGVGMTPEVRDRVFEPFFTTKERGKGTGLGLSTVYGIVKQSGGNIWVYSEPSHGTTFKIYLPRVDEPLEEIKEKMVRKDLPRGNETILVVEDEEEVRKLSGRILRRQGYRVLEASNGGEALIFCEQQKEPVHLILTDVVMPEISGRQLEERLRKVRQDFKVLYMSGYTDNTIAHHGVLEKGVNYIQKPFTPDALARKVREILDG